MKIDIQGNWLLQFNAKAFIYIYIWQINLAIQYAKLIGCKWRL